MGGKLLAAIDQARDGGPPVGNANLGPVVRGAFGASLRADLRQIDDSDGESARVVAAAKNALTRVEVEPKLLLDEAALEDVFSYAQRLAEDGGLSSSNCGGSER